MSNRLDQIERGLALLALTAGVLGFGAVGLCGGYFTAWMVPTAFQPGGGGTVALLLLSLPCLMGGLFMVKVCVEKIRQLLRKPAIGEEAS
jgi:hypothetical protein